MGTDVNAGKYTSEVNEKMLQINQIFLNQSQKAGNGAEEKVCALNKLKSVQEKTGLMKEK